MAVSVVFWVFRWFSGRFSGFLVVSDLFRPSVMAGWLAGRLGNSLRTNIIPRWFVGRFGGPVAYECNGQVVYWAFGEICCARV